MGADMVGSRVSLRRAFLGSDCHGRAGLSDNLKIDPPHSFFCATALCLLCSDTSYNAIGGYFLQPGFYSDVWWQFDLCVEAGKRFCGRVNRRDDWSINILEFLATLVGGWLFIVQSGMRPDYA